MNGDAAFREFKNCEFLNRERNPLYGYNKIRRHSPMETPEHFMAKAMLGFLIMKKGDVIISEAEAKNGRCIDIMQITKNKNFICYELESEGHNKKIDVAGTDTVEIDLRKMPEFAKDGIFELKKWLEQYLIG